jgi:hypothetical protein
LPPDRRVPNAARPETHPPRINTLIVSRPHWVLFTLFCLVFGLLTTVAIAWGAPLLTSQVSRPATWSNAQFWIDDTHAGHYQISHTPLTDNVRLLHLVFEGRPKEKPYYKTNPPPSWTYKLTHAMEGDGIAGGSPWWGVNTLATGWPLRAFRGAHYELWPAQGGLRMVPLTPPPAPKPLRVSLGRFGGPSNDKYTIPLRPIVRGVALNTIFFAAAWGLVRLGVARLRRWHRRRRGRCGACGYDLRGLTTSTPCPECGFTAARYS